jgi:hypothetical protein
LHPKTENKALAMERGRQVLGWNSCSLKNAIENGVRDSARVTIY